MDLHEQCRIVFTAHSKHFFYCRDAVCEFVLRQGLVPIHPFQAFGYFLGDKVDRDLVRRGNFNFVRMADELWVFGDKIANGVVAEITYAHELSKPMRFFSISAVADEIVEIPTSSVALEPEQKYDARQRRQVKAILEQHSVNAYGSPG